MSSWMTTRTPTGEAGCRVEARLSELERTVESLLFLSAEPVPAPALADATGAELHEVVTALERLREHYEYERRGFVVRELAGGYTLTSHPDAEPAARRLLAKPRTPPLTAAQAETLAIVAYLQPVSRPEIARIRGVSAESAATTLLERGMIEEAGRSQFGAVLYRTTELFLKLFGLSELERAAGHRRLRPVTGVRAGAARAPAARRRGAGGAGRGGDAARRGRHRGGAGRGPSGRSRRTSPPPRSYLARPRPADPGSAGRRRHRAPAPPPHLAVQIAERLDLDPPPRRMRQPAPARPPTSPKPRKTPPVTTRASNVPSTSARERQPMSTGSNAPSSRGGGGNAAARRAGAASSTSPSPTLAQPAAERPQPGPRVAQRQPGPAGQVVGGRRSVPGQVAAGQLGEAVSRVAGGAAGPRPAASRGPARYACSRPAIGPRMIRPSIEARTSRCTSACPAVGTPARSSRSRRAVRPSGPSSATARSISATPRAAVSGSTPSCASRRRHRGAQRRGRQQLEQRVVLAADQVQGPAVQPGDEQRAALGQLAVDVGGGHAGGPGPDRQPGAPRDPGPGSPAARSATATGPRAGSTRDSSWALSRRASGSALSVAEGGHTGGRRARPCS